MTLANITLSLDNEDIEQIKKISDNVSLFVRQSITEKLGKADKSFQELEIELNDLTTKRDLKEAELENKMQILFEHQEQLKVMEKEYMEKQILEKKQKQKVFLEKWSPVFDKIDFIKNFDYNIPEWNDIQNLLPIIDKLMKINIRIGVVQLRDFLTLKKQS